MNLVGSCDEGNMPEWRKELKKLSRDGITGTDYIKVVEALNGHESDRGCVLIGQSLTEKCLELIIQKRLPQFSDDDHEKIFGPESPLGTFSAKIKLSYALGIIDDQVRNDLDRMREIRNAFAHHPGFLTFENDAVRRGCAGFLAPDPHAKAPPSSSGNDSKPKRHFINAVMMFLCLTIYDGLYEKTVRIKRARKPLSDADASALREKFRKQLQKQIRSSPQKQKKDTARQDPL